MRFLLYFLLVPNLYAADCSFPGTPPGLGSYRLKPFASGFNRPTKIVALRQDPSHLFVVEQAGIVKSLDKSTGVARNILDIRDRVSILPESVDERGLLGMAFHPRFVINRKLYLDYTTKDPLRTHVSEFTMRADGTIDEGSEKVILEVPQPFPNHNGGEIVFGPDGYLYIGLGDGGSGGDPYGNGQNLKTLLAKILRIDVDKGVPYGIPSDNPFVNTPNARPEIYAYGLRNPWRFSFDRVTGELYAGDVGQDKTEEIDIITSGANYGWNTMEGTECYQPAHCLKTGLTLPVFQYPHNEGVSVTGGFVYRGKRLPELLGVYVFGDYGSGKIWGIRVENGKLIDSKVLVASGPNLTTFGEDSDGEIFIASGNGDIFNLARASSPTLPDFPLRLSETGCFKTLSPFEPVSELIPYEVNVPLWSDGSGKSRFIKLPAGSPIHFDSSKSWNYPIGTVWLKQFSVPTAKGTKNVETRFLVKKSDGIHGYTYRWNEAGDDADFLSGSATQEIEILENGKPQQLNYFFPSPNDCLRCHLAGTNEVLGFNLLQLNRDIASAHGPVSQLSHLQELGVFDSVSNPSVLPKLHRYDDNSVSLSERARGYLHAQCSHCHRPDNPTSQGNYDMRYETFQVGQFFKSPLFGSLGIADAKVAEPGHPEKSILFQRIGTLDSRFRMPPLATARVDKEGVELIRLWIESLR